MLRKFQFSYKCFGLLVALVITACSSSSPQKTSSDVLDKYRYGSVYMRQMNYSLNDKVTKDKEIALKKDGVQIVSVGQEYKLIIPANILFYSNSPRIQWKSYALLNEVVSYMRDFSKVDVKVAGYTQSTGSPTLDRALGINRARNVGDYLWGQEIGAGILYVRGYVDSACLPDRLEISFRSVVM